MATGLLAILDDLATVLDDIAVQSKIPLQKTSGILGDDLALNANQVNGLASSREVPVVLSIAKWSLINKLPIVVLALLLYSFAPWVLTYILVAGGLFLCFEGAEKVAHKVFHKKEASEHDQELIASARSSPEELLSLEKDRIKGAIRTDVILSAEIVFILMNNLTHLPFWKMASMLAILAVLVTILIYGFVLAIVKADDLGLWMQSKKTLVISKTGSALVWLMPHLMRGLSFVGTLALFLVGGELLAHNISPVHHFIQSMDLGPWETLANVATGALAGVIIFAMLESFKGITQKKRHKTEIPLPPSS